MFAGDGNETLGRGVAAFSTTWKEGPVREALFMLAVLAIVTPVFSLMGLGFLVAKYRYLPEGSGQILAQFAFKIAIPALLFRSMLNSGPLDVSIWRLMMAYFLALAGVWVAASLVSTYLLKRAADDQAGIAMAATFGNTVMLGIPIAITAFGPEVTAPLAVLIAVEAPLLWIVATLHMEFSRQGRTMSLGALGPVVKDLATNTIIIALLLGLAGRALELTLPAVPDRIFMLLGQAGIPTALFALGMVLSTFKLAGEGRTISALLLLKLGLFPVLTYVLAAHVFGLPPLWVALATLQAAMPVGANAFLFAIRYDRTAATVSAAMAISTIVAVASVSLLLLFLKSGLAR